MHQAIQIAIQANIYSSLLEWVIFGRLAGFDLAIIHHARNFYPCLRPFHHRRPDIVGCKRICQEIDAFSCALDQFKDRLAALSSGEK